MRSPIYIRSGPTGEKSESTPHGETSGRQIYGGGDMIGALIGRTLEGMITHLSRGGRRTFFPTEGVPWVAQMEAGWPLIRAELDALMVEREKIPNLQDISEEQKLLTEGGQWKAFVFCGYGYRVRKNCALCPETARLIQCIPGLKMAMFSVLAPGKHIPEHRGPYKGVLRYHLGLMVPSPNTLCRIRVRNDVRNWEEGRSLIFDDSYMHEVWNDANAWRVVLFVDFERPLPFPIAALNRLALWGFTKTPFVTGAVDKLRALESTDPLSRLAS